MGTCRATDWYLDLVLLLEICDYRATCCATVGKYFYKQKDKKKVLFGLSVCPDVYALERNFSLLDRILEGRSRRQDRRHFFKLRLLSMIILYQKHYICYI